jgi:5'-nucleotidase
VHSSFLQLSGRLKVVYNIPESCMESFTFDGNPIADKQMFTVGVQQYHYNNFKRIFNIDIADIEKNGKARSVSTSIVDILEEYLSTHQHIDREIDGRLTLIR